MRGGKKVVSYKKLWHLLIDKDMSKMDLQAAAHISTTTLSKLSKGENISTNMLSKICKTLKCNISDIVDYIPDNDTQIDDDNKKGD
jgi:DNA-binding Xre family transcriptional regulator